MVYLAYATIAIGLIHNVVTFCFDRQCEGSASFYKAWFTCVQGNLLSEGREVFLWPTVTLVAFVGTALPPIVSMTTAGAQ